jgi:hypothetical protein
VRWGVALRGLGMGVLGAGLMLALAQIPERLDTQLVLRGAVTKVLAGLSRFGEGVLQLVGLTALLSLALLALGLLVFGLVRIVRAFLPLLRRR